MNGTVDILSRRRLLGQLRPANTTAATLYKPAQGIRAVGDLLIVTNVTAGALTYSVYVDADGTTYDEDSALYFSVSLAANTSVALSFDSILNGLVVDGELGGAIGVKSSTGDGLNFTLFGSEIAR